MKPSWLLLILLAAPGAGLALLSRHPSAPLLAGQVRDAVGPVAGARIRFKGTAQSTHTDRAGRFVLPPSSRRLTAWKDGYFIAGGRSPLLHLAPLPQHDHE